VRQRTSKWLMREDVVHRVGRDADFEEGDKTMFHQQTADAAELYGLEHHFPIGWALAGLAGAGNIAVTVLMLLAQA
jgi:hypothetical protein